MRALATMTALMLGAVTARAEPFGDDFYQDTVTIHSICAGVQGFVVSSLGSAMGYSSVFLPLLEAGVKQDDIASISGVYNGNSSWRVLISSENDFRMMPAVQNNTGFRYLLRLTGGSSEGEIEDAWLGHILGPDSEPDPTNDALWNSNVGQGGHLVVNGADRVAEYQALLNLEIYGGQQFAFDSYSDVITVTFMDGGY